MERLEEKGRCDRGVKKRQKQSTHKALLCFTVCLSTPSSSSSAAVLHGRGPGADLAVKQWHDTTAGSSHSEASCQQTRSCLFIKTHSNSALLTNMAACVACVILSSTSVYTIANKWHMDNVTRGWIERVPVCVCVCVLLMLTQATSLYQEGREEALNQWGKGRRRRVLCY